MINQFLGNNAMVRNMSRVEAAPIYQQNTSCQWFVCSRSGGTTAWAGLAWVLGAWEGAGRTCSGSHPSPPRRVGARTRKWKRGVAGKA